MQDRNPLQDLEDLLWFAYNDIRRSPKTAVLSLKQLREFIQHRCLNNCPYCFGVGVIYNGSPTDDRECEKCQGFGLILTE